MLSFIVVKVAVERSILTLTPSIVILPDCGEVNPYRDLMVVVPLVNLSDPAPFVMLFLLEVVDVVSPRL